MGPVASGLESVVGCFFLFSGELARKLYDCQTNSHHENTLENRALAKDY